MSTTVQDVLMAETRSQRRELQCISSLSMDFHICTYVLCILPNTLGMHIVLLLTIILSSDKQSLIPQDCSSQNRLTQEFYCPSGSKHEGVLKGIAVILEDEGCTGCKGKLAECNQFKCMPRATDCCCHCILFNKPDFVNVAFGDQVWCLGVSSYIPAEISL